MRNGYIMTNSRFGPRKISADGFRCGPTPDPPRPEFCVAVKITEDAVMVRDTKDAANTTLTFNHGEWDKFLQGVKNGEFDL